MKKKKIWLRSDAIHSYLFPDTLPEFALAIMLLVVKTL